MGHEELGDWYLEVNGRKVGPFALDQIQGFLDDGEIRAYHQVTSNEMGGRWISVEELLESHPVNPDNLDAPPPPPPSEIPEDATMVAAPPMSVSKKKKSPAPAPAKPASSPAPSSASWATSVAVESSPEFRSQPRKPEPEPEHAHLQHHVPYTPPPETPSIAELAATYSPDATFQPPPRPEIEISAPPTTQNDGLTDPAMSLFDALQVVRERQAASFHPPAVKVPVSRKPLFKMPTAAKMEEVTKEVTRKITRIRESLPLPEKVPAKMWLAAALAGIILGALTMGVFKLMKPKLHPSPGSLTQVNSLNPVTGQPESPNKNTVEAPRHPLPTAPQMPPHSVPLISHPGADNNAEHNQDRPDNNVQQQEQQQYQDPNNPYPQGDGNMPQNGGAVPGQVLTPEQQQMQQQQMQQQPPIPPPGQFDQYGNPIQPPQPGFDAQGNPLPGYVPPQNVDPNQVPQPGQPGSPGQDAFQPGAPQQ